VGDGFGEVVVAAAPVVDDLWALHSESTCDLGGVHQIVDVDLPAHGDEGTPRVLRLSALGAYELTHFD